MTETLELRCPCLAAEQFDPECPYHGQDWARATSAPASVPGDQLREEIAAALWLIEQPRIPFEQAHPQSQAICRSEADAVLSVVAPLLTKANAGAAPPVDRSTLQHQITAALHTARNRGYRHPDEADTGDLVDAVMGPVDEWDDGLHDDIKGEVARLRAEMATAHEELDVERRALDMMEQGRESWRKQYEELAAAQPGTATASSPEVGDSTADKYGPVLRRCPNDDFPIRDEERGCPRCARPASSVRDTADTTGTESIEESQ